MEINGTRCNSQSIDGDKWYIDGGVTVNQLMEINGTHGVTVNQLMEINGTRCNSQSIDGDKRYMV